jgi:SAM-dependent methyltransferase
MRDFYEAYYAAIERSQAHPTFCERVYGRDLGQHGFADLEQLELVREVVRLRSGQCALDLGCGNGKITEYLFDCTGAHMTGLDVIPVAIHIARQRTMGKAERLAFVVGDINRLKLPVGAYDVILSIDTLYFSNDYKATLRELKGALRPGGQMAILFSHGREPWMAIDEFPEESLLPSKTPLAGALQANDLSFHTWDLTDRDYDLALRRQEVLAELKPLFEAEGNLFLYENLIRETEGVRRAIEEGFHARYLYHVQLVEPAECRDGRGTRGTRSPGALPQSSGDTLGAYNGNQCSAT